MQRYSRVQSVPCTLAARPLVNAGQRLTAAVAMRCRYESYTLVPQRKVHTQGRRLVFVIIYIVRHIIKHLVLRYLT